MKPPHGIGRARTVLVFGQGDASRAVVTTVVARSRRRSGGKRLSFGGPVAFEASVTRHFHETVLPLVDQVTAELGIRPQAFNVAVANLGAASSTDVGLHIAGFSADTAVALAMLSAAARIPLSDRVATTGHIASSDGDISAVRSLPAKLEAVLRTPSIGCLVCPSLDGDASLAVLMPQEKERIEAALARARGRVRLVQVSSFAQLLRETLSDEAIVLGSLRSGFFDGPQGAEPQDSGAGEAVKLLAQGNGQRFWGVLEARLLAGDAARTRELLGERTRYQVRRKQYPGGGFGRQLLQLVRSMPPATRRLQTAFPLLPEGQCLLLGRLAREGDYEDVQLLFDAAAGRVAWPVDGASADTPLAASPTRDAEAAVDAVLAEISSEALARRIGLPIDAARAAYALPSVTASSYDEFMDIVSAFHLHLLRHTANAASTVSSSDVAAEAQALVERAFHDRGGFRGAEAEARDATQGGLRFILDCLTERYKSERLLSHVNAVLKEAVDPADWDGQVAFMAALLRRIGPDLPPELRQLPPAQLARHYEPIVQAYVRSLDRLKQLLRAL